MESLIQTDDQNHESSSPIEVTDNNNYHNKPKQPDDNDCPALESVEKEEDSQQQRQQHKEKETQKEEHQEIRHEEQLIETDKSLDLLGSFEGTTDQPLYSSGIGSASNILDDIPESLTTIAKPDPIITHTKPDFEIYQNYSQDSLTFESSPLLNRNNDHSALTADNTSPHIVESEIVETEMIQPKDQYNSHVETSSHIDNDLADFELPQFSGSSSGSELKSQPSPPLKSSSPPLSTTTTPTSKLAINKPTTSSCSPNLSAVKNLLIANYSRISHVLHWKDPIETGIIFGIGATIILALTFFSIISVFAYSGLGLILGSSTMRLFKVIMKMLNMPSETRFDNIWNKALNINVSLSSKKLHDLVDSSLDNLNDSLGYMKRVLLVEDKFATITVGLSLYVLTYLGSWFNGMTLITLGYLSLFSLPVVYEKNKDKIDDYINLASGHVASTVSLVSKKVSSMTSSSGHRVTSSTSVKQD